MRSKQDVVKEIFEIINKDSKAAISFFSELKDIEIFLDLVDIGAFDKALLPLEEKKNKGYIHPYWPQSIYLEFVARHISTEGTDREDPLVRKYLDVLKSLTVETLNSTVENAIFSCFTILPAKIVSCEEIQHFISYISKSNLVKYSFEYVVHEGFKRFVASIDNNEHDRNVFKCYLKCLLGSRSEKKSYGDYELTFFNGHWLQEFRNKKFNFEEVYKHSPYLVYDANFVFKDLITELLKEGDIDQNTHYWRPAIEDHVQNKYHDSAQSIYTSLLFESLSFLIPKGEIDSLLDELKESNFKTLNRIYIALATAHPNHFDLNSCAEKLLSYGLDSSLRYEGFHFLENHFSNLKPENQKNILDAISSMVEEYARGEEEQILFSAWKKIRWLQAIKNTGNHSATLMFQNCLKITGSEAEHPEFSSYIGGGWVGPTSPWSKEDFDKATPDEIVQKLKYFQSVDDFKGPSKEGLARSLEDFVFEDPIKCSAIVKSLDQFDPIYISALFDGYAQAWKEKKHVPVKNLLDKFNDLVQKSDFYESFKIKESKALWAVNSLLRFIKAGVREDENAFDEIFNPLCYEIVRKLTQKVYPTGEYISPSDAYTRAINEPRGVLFETAILLALREARLAQEDKVKIEKAWQSLLTLIREPLETKDGNEVSLHALIGAYYRQFLYLNDTWLLDNLSVVAPLELKHQSLWLSFMQGFGYVTAFVKDVYKRLDDYGVLLKFLRFELEGDGQNSRLDRLQDRIIELSLIAYVLSVEELDSGIMGEIISTQDANEWKKLINSIVPITGHDPIPEHQLRVRQLLTRLFQIYEDGKDKEKWKDHFSGVSRLLELMDDINDKNVLSIIKIAVRNSEGNWDLNAIVEYLYKFVPEQPKIVGELFVEALSHSSGVPTYPADKISVILKSIKNAKEDVLFARLNRFYNDREPGFKIELENE